jgi:carboxypeptidase family protein
VAKSRIPRAAAALVLVAASIAPSGCRRARRRWIAPSTSAAVPDVRDVRCVERPEGCIWCEGRGPTPPLVDPDAIPPSVCDPQHPADCVDFCSRLTPECAVPWRTVPSCLLPTEQDFRRELFRRDTADRAEALVQGRITDESGRRVEGAKVRVWFQGTAVADETSGKDGAFRLKLPAGSSTYTLRISHPGLATEITDLHIDRGGVIARSFRLGPESTIRGKIVGDKNDPVAGVAVHAVRSPDDPVDAGEAVSGEDGSFVLGGLDARRYFLRAAKFGWLPQMLKWGVLAPAARVGFRLVRTGVIEGRVVDADGEGQANASVVALLSTGAGTAGSPIIWTVDPDGRFAQDRFDPGTYYLWAKHGEMLAFPPEKLEISASSLTAQAELKLSHKGAHVRGRVVVTHGGLLDPDTRAVMFGLSPLALPRKAVGEIDRDGVFAIGGLLPGRYEISVRLETRTMTIVNGPREVEIPIEPDATVDLPDAIVVRPQAVE